MTIKNNKIENKFDFSRVFIEKSFKHYPSDPWEPVSKKAAEWLYRAWQTHFSDKNFYLFYSPSSLVDNRINQYKLQKRIINYENYTEDMIICDEDKKIVDKEIIYWKIFGLSEKVLSIIINDFKGNGERASLFFSNQENLKNFPLEELLLKRHNKEYRKINKRKEVDVYLEKGMIPIRLWGEMDDPELFCQIFV